MPETIQETREKPAGPWHTRTAERASELLAADPRRGLSSAAAADRLREWGRNQLAAAPPEPWWEEVWESLTEPLVLLLIAVGVLYGLLGELADAVTIFFVIVAVAAVEIVNESRAKRAIASLRTLAAPRASAIRDGVATDLPTAELVPGDVVLLEPGTRVPADLRLLESAALRVDESSLTGESVPVSKDAGAVLLPEAALGDRRNLAFAGTVVAAGKGRAVVVATGPDTELGRIGRLAEEAREPKTPLQRQLAQLAGWLVWLALAFSVLIPLLGVLVAGRPWREMLLTGLTLAFATIPEELPILITVVLGIGAYRLARRNAIVKRLRAAEELGGVSVICTDKTGTLTENRMHVAEIDTGGAVLQDAGQSRSQPAERALEIGVLANDAQLAGNDGQSEFIGDPTETALLAFAQKAGLDIARLRADARVLEEFPFDDARKRMSVVYERAGKRWLALKGAPESVLSVCREAAAPDGAESIDAAGRREIQADAEAMAARGLRVLALAERRLAADEPLELATVETDLTLMGLVGLEDPPRAEVPEAVRTLQSAGVRVLMITGDHPATARAIAERVGIDAGRVVLGRELEESSDSELGELVRHASVFARVSPEHKLRVVRALQAAGAAVAVTGDGVNDAPALREASIGVAMGERGTDIAREAADVVLADDNFATLTAAVRVGRSLYVNLQSAVRYYLAAKVALITASLVPVLLGLPIPFAPVQIIVLELFMDLGASTTFVAERPPEGVMRHPPRDPSRPLLDSPERRSLLTGGVLLALAVLTAYLWAGNVGLAIEQARTAAFAAWIVGHLVLAAWMRPATSATDVFANRPFLLWAAAALATLALGATVPFLGARLHLAPLPAVGWGVACGAGIVLPSLFGFARGIRAAHPAGASIAVP